MQFHGRVASSLRLVVSFQMKEDRNVRNIVDNLSDNVLANIFSYLLLTVTKCLF